MGSNNIICRVDGCNKKRKKKGTLCSMHSARWFRTGRLDKKTTRERLLESIDIDEDTGCWNWNKYKNKEGYGRLRVNSKKILAHRASYLEFNGEIKDDLLVCHKCDNPACINPEHLFLGTNYDNVHDSINKGRMDCSARAKHRWKVCPTFRKPEVVTCCNGIKTDIEGWESRTPKEPLCHSCKYHVISSGGNYFCDLGVESTYRDTNECKQWNNCK